MRYLNSVKGNYIKIFIFLYFYILIVLGVGLLFSIISPKFTIQYIVSFFIPFGYNISLIIFLILICISISFSAESFKKSYIVFGASIFISVILAYFIDIKVGEGSLFFSGFINGLIFFGFFIIFAVPITGLYIRYLYSIKGSKLCIILTALPFVLLILITVIMIINLNNDIGRCGLIDDEKESDNCYYTLALSRNSLKICKRISFYNPELFAKCIVDIHINLNKLEEAKTYCDDVYYELPCYEYLGEKLAERNLLTKEYCSIIRYTPVFESICSRFYNS